MDAQTPAQTPAETPALDPDLAPAIVDPEDAPAPGHTRAAYVALVIARLARTRAQRPAYADAAPALHAIAKYMDDAAVALVNDTLTEFDGVKVTNALPSETWEAVSAAERAADTSTASTGFRPGFAETVNESFWA